MTTLELKSWKKGLKTVSLIEAVNQHSIGSLMRAKAAVERFLDGEVIRLEFETDLEKERFKKIAEELGVMCS